MTAILIVDDSPVYRHQARMLLEAAGVVVAGEAADGPSALTAVRDVRPDVVLLDIGLPGMDGISVAEAIADDPQPSQVVLVSAREAETYGTRLGRVRAAGFIRKDELTWAALEVLLRRQS